MRTIKDYIIAILLIASVVFGFSYFVAHKNNVELNNKWSISENNYKASNRKNLEYKLSIEQMKLSLDSLDIKLLEFKNKSKIKDSKIKSLMIIIDSLSTKDTVRFNDTIFVKDLKLDTIIGDKWVKKKLQLKYPGTIIIDTDIYNEKNIIWFSKRETINPPNKFFLFRWLQKKQTLVEIKIEDLNPYFKTREFKYNTIIK